MQGTEDYIKDGLLYCGKCHTPKQSRAVIYNRHPPCECSCVKERRNAEEAMFKRLDEQRKVAQLRSVAFSDAEMKRWTFDRDDHANSELSETARRYADSFPGGGKGLMLFGGTGTGKTFAACCIANALINRGFSCIATNFPRLTNEIYGRQEGKQDYIDGLNGLNVLLIDDLGAERKTEYVQEIVFNVIDGRYRTGKPLIVTSNLTAWDFNHPENQMRERIYSRLFEMCEFVEVRGKDRRKEQQRRDLLSRYDHT